MPKKSNPAITLYSIFAMILSSHADGALPSVGSQVGPMLRELVILTSVGMGIGLGFGLCTGPLLRLVRRRSKGAHVEAVAVLALAYLAFYVSQGPAHGSGVIAVSVFGLYGAATWHWGAAEDVPRAAARVAVWDGVALVANAIVFFWAGAASTSYIAR